MLKKVTRKRAAVIPDGRFAIVASQYNARFVDSMLEAAQTVLTKAQAIRIEIVRVPGAFEIPVVAARLASRSPRQFDCILCLGLVIRGETAHAQLISEAVSVALAHIQITHYVPLIHGVLLVENEQQAQVRCCDPRHNRGLEAAQTALSMVQVMQNLELPR